MRRFRRLRENRGSALVWAMCAMLVLTLLVAAMLGISLSYYNRSLEKAAAKKAELLAQSGAAYAAQMAASDSADEWLPLTAEDYGSANGSFIEKTKRVYFDNSVEQSIVAWLESSPYKGKAYHLEGTKVVFEDGSLSLSESDKSAIIESNESENCAELFFAVEKAFDDPDDSTYVMRITAVANAGEYSAASSALFTGTAETERDTQTGKEEVKSAWAFMGYAEG